MTDITMPRLADAMEQGTIVKWLVAEGDPVAVGDELCEIETDKATVAYEAEVEGVLSILVPEGATAAVGEAIARVGVVAAVGEAQAQAPAEAASPEPAAVAGNGAPEGRVVATPLARRIAAAHDVALE